MSFSDYRRPGYTQTTRVSPCTLAIDGSLLLIGKKDPRVNREIPSLLVRRETVVVPRQRAFSPFFTISFLFNFDSIRSASSPRDRRVRTWTPRSDKRLWGRLCTVARESQSRRRGQIKHISMPPARRDDTIQTITRKVRIHVPGMATGTLSAIARSEISLSLSLRCAICNAKRSVVAALVLPVCGGLPTGLRLLGSSRSARLRLPTPPLSFFPSLSHSLSHTYFLHGELRRGEREREMRSPYKMLVY